MIYYNYCKKFWARLLGEDDKNADAEAPPGCSGAISATLDAVSAPRLLELFDADLAEKKFFNEDVIRHRNTFTGGIFHETSFTDKIVDNLFRWCSICHIVCDCEKFL